jgi:hypothetical protein
MTTIFNYKAPDLPCEIPDGTCLLGYRGSIAHGMFVPSTDPNSIDDVDLMGVVIGEPRNYFGLKEWGSRGTKEYKKDQWDCVYYEIRKMFSLLLQGNPNVVGFIWMLPGDYLILGKSGRRIIENKGIFVGKHIYNAFCGYAHAQFEKMETRNPDDLRRYIAITNELKYRGDHPNHKGEKFPRPYTLRWPDNANHSVADTAKYHMREDDNRRVIREVSGEAVDAYCTSTESLLQGLRSYQKKGENIGYMGDKRKGLVLEHGYDTKNAAHLIRLLRMGTEFLSTGELLVKRPDAEELLDIKHGKWPLSRIKEYSKDLFEGMKGTREKSPLPEGPDYDKAESLLCDILRSELL